MRRCGRRGWVRGKTATSTTGTNGGLFKSTDGGETWKQLKNGLPEDLVQINVAIAPSDPNRMYATLSTTHERAAMRSGAGLGVYRSDDAGESWTKITDDPRPALKIGGGDLPVPGVDSKNPDIVYSASIVTMRSTDGGKTWMSLRGAPGGDDYQNIWINPRQSQHPSAGERPGRAGEREQRGELELVVQPADRAALSRGDDEYVSLPAVRGAAGERVGVHFEPRQ